MKLSKKLAVTTAIAFGLLTSAATAEDVTLRIQTHNARESTQGKLLVKFVDDIQTMSEGSITVEMFFSAAVVASAETFDAVMNGVLDCDMTNGSYQTGKNPAFQFVADTMGGYDTAMQYLAWVNFGGGREAINELYAPYGMHFVGAQVGGQESLNSSKPLPGIESLKGFKFRSPPGMETEIFQSLGASPVVMDFTEVFTALETGIVDGADASTLAVNTSLGLYDIAKHTTYPGFHSMSSDQLACSQATWDSLTPAQQRIIETAHKKLMADYVMVTMIENGEAIAKVQEKEVTMYDWSAEDRAAFRNAAKAAWDNWATKSPEAATMVNSHKDFLKRIGLSN